MWSFPFSQLNLNVQYTPRGFPTFRKTPRKIFRAENLPVFPESVFLECFSFFLPRIFYQPSIDKLRELSRFSSAKLGGNKMAAIDDYSIKLHLAWQFLCSSAKKHIVIDTYKYVHVYTYLDILVNHLQIIWEKGKS